MTVPTVLLKINAEQPFQANLMGGSVLYAGLTGNSTLNVTPLLNTVAPLHHDLS